MALFVEHIVNHPIMVAGLVAMLIAVAVYELRHRVAGAGAFGITAAEAVRLINKGAMVIDVRTPEAYGQGHIVNARNIAVEALTTERAVVKKQKNKVFVLVCDSGAQSGRGASVLRKAGFDNSFSIKGGLTGWRSDNLPVVKQP